MNVDVTPALRQAAGLFALAQHLTRHPHLAPVLVLETKMQLQWVQPHLQAAKLLDWADSLTGPTATVQGIKGEAYVHVTGSTPWGEFTVWSTVSGLLDSLGSDDDADRAPLDLAVFRAFADGQGRS